MSSRVIPKERSGHFRRWQLSGVEDPAVPDGTAPGTGESASTVEADPVIPGAVAMELDRLRREATDEAMSQGLEAGYAEGYAAGREAAAEDARRLGELVEALDAERLLQDERLAREVLQLGLAVARQMLRGVLNVKDGVVIQVIQEALAALPSLSGHVRVFVHPDDVAGVRDFIGREHAHLAAKVMEDSRMERGDFRIESTHNEIDGAVASRWREIVECLGADVSWLD